MKWLDPSRTTPNSPDASVGMPGCGAAPPPAFCGDPSFQNNAPDLLLSGRELPCFKFSLDASVGKVMRQSYGKEATVQQLPISRGLAGVSMKIEPGGMRELHWHATAAEWAFVLAGRDRTTVLDPQGDAETNDLDPGDVGYFPRGSGHSIEDIGSTPARMLIGFNTGVYSTINLSQWIAGNPADVLATNFSRPASFFNRLPKGDVFIAPKDGPGGRRGCRPVDLHAAAVGYPHASSRAHPGRAGRRPASPRSRSSFAIISDQRR